MNAARDPACVNRRCHGLPFTEKETRRKELCQARERVAGAVPAADADRLVRAVPARPTGPGQAQNQGLQAAFQSIYRSSAIPECALDFVSYQLGTPPFDVKECQQRGLTYAAPLRARCG